MSSRAVRKALKRLEQEEAAKKLDQQSAQDAASEDEEEEEDSHPPAPSNPFAMLNETQPSEDEETIAVSEDPAPSARAKKSKNKKKKKKVAATSKDGASTPSTPKDTAPSIPAASALDDVDRAIQEISQKYGETASPSPSPSSSPHPAPSMNPKYALLSIDPKHLDADLELRKLFGKIVDLEARESRRQPIHGVSGRTLNRIKATQAQRKYIIMKPRDEWQLFAAYNKHMLDMDALYRMEGVTRFKFVHSRRYQDVQMQFFIAALGGDPNVLTGLLRQYPFHVDTCIQVSEFLKHHGNLSEAAELIERALFSLNCGLHAKFNLTLGTTRLPFEYFENRSFYLAIWHHTESLGRRGCWRTALEFTKLLFSLEPEANPYCALLSIDFPAIKSKEYTYLIQLRDSEDWIDETGYLLNIHYSAALAEYLQEKDQTRDHEKSSKELEKAILRFPWLIAQMFYTLKLDFPAEFPSMAPPSPLQALYTELYIFRSKELWTPPEMSKWLVSVIKRIASQVREPEPDQALAYIPLNVARHLLVLNVPALLGHIPREYTSKTQLASDPLPPHTSISPYDAPMRSMRGMAQDDTAVYNFVQRLVRGHPRVNPRGPEPAAGEQFEEDEAEDVTDEEDEETESNETLVAQLTNTFRNVFGWFGTRERDDRQDDEHEDNGHGID